MGEIERIQISTLDSTCGLSSPRLYIGIYFRSQDGKKMIKSFICTPFLARAVRPGTAQAAVPTKPHTCPFLSARVISQNPGHHYHPPEVYLSLKSFRTLHSNHFSFTPIPMLIAQRSATLLQPHHSNFVDRDATSTSYSPFGGEG